jgi:hypothetical protein
MSDVAKLDTKALTRQEAEAIAKEIDPQAGGFFRNMLIRAALMGAQKQAAKLAEPAPAPQETQGGWAGLRDRYNDIA